jgi:glyoxylase-like metal-dependent hydrolase (beta-lactamase superfamily II)
VGYKNYNFNEMQIKQFIFNHYQLNTYLVYDELGEAILIDAGNSTPDEDQQINDFLTKEMLHLQGIYLTHGHIDHIVGLQSIAQKHQCKIYAHRDSLAIIESSKAYAPSLGFAAPNDHLTFDNISETDTISLGKGLIKIIESPGHAAGSLCYYNEVDQWVIVGDVLFRGSIGRTDLPTGDFDLLSKNIQEKLYILPNAVKVYPGHGPSTSIGFEKINNPFVNLL